MSTDDAATQRGQQCDHSTRRSNSEYTVGWICAVVTELVAALLFLDEKHQGPEALASNDANTYTLGRMGGHNVVIASLPDGEYGIASAAGVAKDMLHSFPNVKIGLMVGIGGGAPSPKHDIRLGDVVISSPREGHGGVFQYDFGKAIGGQGFHTTGFLNQPPVLLRNALTSLKADHILYGNQIRPTIEGLLRRYARLQEYRRPQSKSDRLYRPEVFHPSADEGINCEESCGDALVARHPRTNDADPVVHYGLIASANTLMRDASIRDRLAREKGVLCFEMEAAGLMNHFPCLVIRGICDYADTHKNKEWQGYAAMTAAAYAKDLLCQIVPRQVEAEATIAGVLGDLHKIAAEQLQMTKAHTEKKFSDEEAKCHQLFRLTTGTRDTTYEWYKDRVDKRVEGTCQWFLGHPNFKTWLAQDSGPLLVSADPGCGKSVLARYLVDHVLPGKGITVCYFFFKDHDQNTVRQALCAVLHQLFKAKPSLIKYAQEQHKQDGEGLISSTDSLWKVLGNAIQDPQADRVVVVLDALDECAEHEIAHLVQNVKRQLLDGHSVHGRLRYLLTSRPYDQIVSRFYELLKAFPNIHIPGEDASEVIIQEVNCVVTHRVSLLSEVKGLTHATSQRLEEELHRATHRTYLWVYLVFDYLEKEDFKRTPRGVESAVATLPKSVDDAYEKILSRSKNDPMVRKALSIILVANRPLTLEELNIAVNLDEDSCSFGDLDLEDERSFEKRLRSWCGLFISVHHGKVYFLHQTVREFLSGTPLLSEPGPSGPGWHHSIPTNVAHALLAKACLIYLNFDAGVVEEDSDRSTNSHAFLDYSVKAWAKHFYEAGTIIENRAISLAVRICDLRSKSYSAWFRIYWSSLGRMSTGDFSGMMVAAFFGLEQLAQRLLDQGVELDLKDQQYGQTPLSWAAQNGHEGIVKLLLATGKVDADSKDGGSRTPLSWAALNGHEGVVELLLETGKVDVNSKDQSNQTPLSWAALNGHEGIVSLLLATGKVIADSKDGGSRTPLSWATEKGHEGVVELLLATGKVDVDSTDFYNQTPLSWAARNGHEGVVKLLLATGKVGANSTDKSNRTPLSRAAENGYEGIVRLLLATGTVNADSKDAFNQTPLSRAAEEGHEGIVKLLLATGKVDVNSTDFYNQTPLSRAALNGHKRIANLLSEAGERDANSEDQVNYSINWLHRGSRRA